MRARITAGLAGVIRVVVGVLWLLEGLTKYRAGFGGADIQLVVDSTAGNGRVPEFYQAFTSGILGAAPSLFGFLVPVLEVGLGVALIFGVLTRLCACVSIGTLMLYWLADQLIAQYPIMVVLSTAVLLAPVAATRYSVTQFVLGRTASAANATRNSGSWIREWL